MSDVKFKTMRHNSDNLDKSLKINAQRLNISEQLLTVLQNTAKVLMIMEVKHKAEES